MSKKKICNELSKVIDDELVQELLKEYDLAKRSHFLEDWEKTILHAGKFSEMSLVVVKNIVDSDVVDLNQIYFDKLFNDLTNRKKDTAEDDILMLAIPRAAMSIYSIRNKKRVAHIKSIDPDHLDSEYCLSTCDWILSQFLMLYSRSDPKDVSSLIHSLIEKHVPFVEQFEDGSLVVLKDNLSFKEQFLIALYKLAKRVAKKELTFILKTYPQLVNSTSNNLAELKLVHTNDNGVILTKKGLKFVEDTILL